MSYKNVDDFLKKCTGTNPERYNFEGECDVEDFSKMKAIPRYLTYKATDRDYVNTKYENGKRFAEEIQGHSEYMKLVDCDGWKDEENLQLIYDVYSTLWNWKRGIGKDISSIIENSGFDCLFGPDTMNSVQNTLNDIVREIIKNDSGNEYKDWRDKLGRRNVSLRYCLELYASCEEKCTKEKKNEFLKALEKVGGLSEYIDLYHTIGNFVLVPYGYSSYRGKWKEIEYWDGGLRFLKGLGFNNFNHDGQCSADYYRYINYFFLWDYVNIYTDYVDSLMPSSDSTKRFTTYFNRVIPRILNRGRFMVAMLRVANQIGEEEYAKLRSDLFCGDKISFKNCEDALEAVKDYI
jgi:hypothetical protein